MQKYMTLKRLLPSSWVGYVLIVLSIILQAAGYWWRANLDEFVMDAGLGLFFFFVGLSPFILLGVTLIFLVILANYWYSFRENGSLLPLIVLLFGSTIAMITPLPPSPAETAFYQNRSDYETVVTLAKQNQLGHEGRCGHAFSLPENYQFLSQECVFVEYEPEFAISFSPSTSHRTIAYAETKEALSELGDCGEFGAVFKKIEPNWYICTPAQD